MKYIHANSHIYSNSDRVEQTMRLILISLIVVFIGCEGKEGLMGPQGERGRQGEQGERGLVGIQGSQGPQGPEGDTSEIETRVDSLEALIEALIGNTTPLSDANDGSPVFNSPPVGLFGDIRGLDFIRIDVFNSKNWDADIDDDGVELEIAYKNNEQSSSLKMIWSDARVAARIQIYIATEAFSEEKKYDEPFFDNFFTLNSSEDKIQITFETYEPLISDEDVSTQFDGDKVVYVVVEGTVILADASSFGARTANVLDLPNR